MQLYVGGLSNDTKEENIVELFSSICPVQLVTIIRDIESGKSRGFAIVKILSEEDGEKAIRQLNGFALRGTNLLVRKMPETLPGEMEFREWLADHATKVLKHVGIRKAQIILDYGCGSGTFTIPSARIVGKQGRVYAFEARPDLLERIKERAGNEGLTNIKTGLSDRSKPTINLKDESVDIILVYDVMHEIGNRLALLEELSRVLRRDGFLSVFPMHMGTDSMLDVMRECGLFCLRDRYSPPGFKAASEILNFDKCQPTR
ncbi:MAG TPA: methyltransferase domain-containing protein [Dehalococcoidia bacterium]|nr:methyltransferase domain-containing protein [Dehalococcoidia bacterium]